MATAKPLLQCLLEALDRDEEEQRVHVHPQEAAQEQEVLEAGQTFTQHLSEHAEVESGTVKILGKGLF